jgi:hypothetical protein
MVRRILFKIIVLFTVFLSLQSTEAQPRRPTIPSNSYIVQVTEGVDPGQVGRGVTQRTNGKLGHVYRNAVKGFSIQLPNGLPQQAIEVQAGVRLVEPDIAVYAVVQTLPTGVNRIEAENSGVTTPVDVDIAIIDTGIDIDHPDLNVVGGRHFYSLFGLLSYEDNLFDDDNGHGTHCAGIAAAKDNDIGVVGVAPGARLYAVKVLDSSGSGYLSDVIAGIDWVTAHSNTIEVANMSLSAIANSSIFRTAIQNSVAAGIIHFVAAGNDARDVYGIDGIFGTSDDVLPASYPEAAAISAMVDLDGIPGGLKTPASAYGNDDSFANFSNDSHSVVAGNPVTSPGKAIDLLMPGVEILSCYMNGTYAIGSGTSMASPHAAGLAALYIAGNGRATNASGVYAIRQALINAGIAQTDPRGLALQNDFDGNKENIGWAGSSEPPSPVDNPPSVSITNPAEGATVSGQVIVTADALDDIGVVQVEFFVNGVSIGADTTGGDGWSASWDTTGYSNGDYTVSATATDTASQTSDDLIGATVDNSTDYPPSVTITYPSNGATVSGQVTVTADALDDDSITRVEFFVDGVGIGVDTNGSDGWSASWDTTQDSNGDYILSATATDSASQTSNDSITVMVNNVTDNPPSVMITNPADGTTVSGQVNVTADALDDDGVTQVEFFVDGSSIGVDDDDSDGWSANWDTALNSNGGHSVSATATDTTGQNTSDSVSVTVDNPQGTRVAQINVTAMPLMSYGRWWLATAMVTVTEDGASVAGATVEGVWSGLYKKAMSNTTDVFGFISFETGWLRKAGTVTFTVTRVISPDGQEYILEPAEPSGSTQGP